MAPGLRKETIEDIGRKIFEKYFQNKDDTCEPMMVPPIPDSKFIDKLPEDVVLQGQDGYEEEVKVFRCFEEIKRPFTVVHQLEYTHEQYSVFCPSHQCHQKKCKRGMEVHPCHQADKNIDGETDFVVLGEYFVAVFEVKGLSVAKYESCCSELISKCSVRRNDISSSVQNRNAVKFEACRDDALRQRNRIVDLVKSVDSTLDVYQFTIFSNINQDEVDEQYLSDKTLLFSEDLNNFTAWFETNIPPPQVGDEDVNMMVVKCCLLGLWCIDPDNKWKDTTCSLSHCINNVNDKLRRALVTKKLVDEETAEQSRSCDKNRKQKQVKEKKYPENPGMVDAPDIFKEYLKVRSLTKDQLDVFNSNERFLLVDGPAGSGKTIAMMGKVINLALTSQEKRILIILTGSDDDPAIEHHMQLLNTIRHNITCEIVTYRVSQEGDISDRLVEAHALLSKQLSDCTSNISLLIIEDGLSESMHGLITKYDYVFCDDYQKLLDFIIYESNSEPGSAHKNIISEGLLPVLKNRDKNNTSIWILCDDGQSLLNKLIHERPELIAVKTSDDEFRSYFVNSQFISVNLRNTYEISEVLSIIREHYEKIDHTGTGSVKLPQHKKGHFLRGGKPVIYLLKDKETTTWRDILIRELYKLIGSNSCLENKDIAVLYDGAASYERKHMRDTAVNGVVEGFNTADNTITVGTTGKCVSAEWAAVIYIYRYSTYSTTVTLPDNSEKEVTHSYTIARLYSAISRARVYSTVILFDYRQNLCEFDDQLLDELRERSDVCRIIDI